ncbi:RING finger protein 24 isoform X2 [Peromyscus maniculatus bairdii]|uniref:RING finger protein 24 isoform X2 n=1 Tax=Peromyscus maniculatus bairdii TaxID=230844 RepID=UPI003FD47099
MSSDFPHYNFRMPNIGFQNLPLNIYIVVFGTAVFVFILSLLFCCYLIRLRHQAHKEFYAYKQVILKEKVKELNLHELCAVCLEDFKPRDELGICPCKHAFHRKMIEASTEESSASNKSPQSALNEQVTCPVFY